MLQKLVSSTGSVKSFYNDKLLTYISGTWETSYISGTTDVYFTSNVTGTLNMCLVGASTASVYINDIKILNQGSQKPSYYGKKISDENVFDIAYIKKGDTLRCYIQLYYTNLMIYYSR
jgi:hypothetical protein